MYSFSWFFPVDEESLYSVLSRQDAVFCSLGVHGEFDGSFFLA
jgi:hypothetical protein